MTESKFFDRLLNKSVSKALSWLLIGFLIFIILILSMIPAQEVYAEGNKFLSWGLVFISAFMSAARVSAYKQYTENQKSRKIVEILQYHPVRKREIWKLKMRVLCKFQAKVTGVALVVQMIASLIAYKTVSIDNFEYIVLNIFIVVVIGEVIIDWFSGVFEKE